MSKSKMEPEPRKKPGPRGAWQPVFLKELAERGVIVHAAMAAGISRSTAYEARDNHPEFAELWAEAESMALASLEIEMYRRAVVGTEKPVYQGGKKVGTIREYSDTLMIFLAKALDPKKYREPKGEVHVHNEAAAISPDIAAAAIEAAMRAHDEKRKADGFDGPDHWKPPGGLLNN